LVGRGGTERGAIFGTRSEVADPLGVVGGYAAGDAVYGLKTDRQALRTASGDPEATSAK
jgi:hypothetical protein